MRSERLSAAFDGGIFAWPETGRVLVLRPRGEDLLPEADRARLHIVTGFKPDFDAFAARGYQAAIRPEGEYSAALICLPRARELARAMLAEAVACLAEGTTIWVDGQKTDGVESIWRDLRDAGAEPGAPYSKAHGKLFSFAARALPEAWIARDLDAGGFVTRPGVFSADAPDRGSAMLAQALPEKLSYRVADLGAGWGYLTQAILARRNVTEVHLFEAEADALDCARRNISDDRATFHWADATRLGKEVGLFGAVVCNPPFHTDRTANPKLGIAFLQTAAKILSTSGTLWLVANRQLPYEVELNKLFREVEMIGGDTSFRLWRASRPIPAGRSK